MQYSQTLIYQTRTYSILWYHMTHSSMYSTAAYSHNENSRFRNKVKIPSRCLNSAFPNYYVQLHKIFYCSKGDCNECYEEPDDSQKLKLHLSLSKISYRGQCGQFCPKTFRSWMFLLLRRHSTADCVADAEKKRDIITATPDNTSSVELCKWAFPHN